MPANATAEPGAARRHGPRRRPGAGLLAVTHALMMREIHTRFGRDNMGFAWIVLEPALFCLGIIALWSVIKSATAVDLPIVPFLLTGYMPLLMYRHCVMRAMRCMQANAALLYHRPVSVLAMYLARFAVEILGALGAFFITGLVFWVWGFVEPPEDMALMLAGWGLYAAISVGVGLAVGALSERSELVEKLWQPVSYVTIPISGTFFMVDWLPAWAQPAAAAIPFVTAVEMIRGGYFGPSVTIHLNLPVALGFAALSTIAGLWFLRDARHHVEVE